MSIYRTVVGGPSSSALRLQNWEWTLGLPMDQEHAVEQGLCNQGDEDGAKPGA